MIFPSLAGIQDPPSTATPVIILSRKTVKFPQQVCQLASVAGWGEGQIRTDTLPWGLIIMVAILGSALVSRHPLGWLVLLGAVSGGLWNAFKPKQYGLVVTLHGGDKQFFPTRDRAGLRAAIAVIHEWLETQSEIPYQITLDRHRVTGHYLRNTVLGSNQR